MDVVMTLFDHRDMSYRRPKKLTCGTGRSIRHGRPRTLVPRISPAHPHAFLAAPPHVVLGARKGSFRKCGAGGEGRTAPRNESGDGHDGLSDPCERTECH